jgi:hypothetical protein
MAVFETREAGSIGFPTRDGTVEQQVREVYVDGVHYATLRPLGGTLGQYGIFLVGSTKRYRNPAMEGPCPDETTIFGLAHAAEMTKAIHQGHDVNSTGALSAMARRFLSPGAIADRVRRRIAAQAAEALGSKPQAAPTEPVKPHAAPPPADAKQGSLF